jgi:hypothetical protein
MNTKNHVRKQCHKTSMTSLKILIHSFLFFLLIPQTGFTEPYDITISKIKEKNSFIQDACRQFDINPCYLSAIIFTERTLNYDWTDETWDVIIAKSGKNSSVGFCQIKLKTAYFIECQLHTPTSRFYPGKKYENTLQGSKNPQELIRKLTDDQTNILYAAAYLRIIQSRWQKAGHPIDNCSDILGTLYSTGLFHPDGTERCPKNHPKSNEFGKKVMESVKLFEK